MLVALISYTSMRVAIAGAVLPTLLAKPITAVSTEPAIAVAAAARGCYGFAVAAAIGAFAAGLAVLGDLRHATVASTFVVAIVAAFGANGAYARTAALYVTVIA